MQWPNVLPMQSRRHIDFEVDVYGGYGGMSCVVHAVFEE